VNALAALPSADVLLELTDVFAGNHVRNSAILNRDFGQWEWALFLQMAGQCVSQCLSQVRKVSLEFLVEREDATHCRSIVRSIPDSACLRSGNCAAGTCPTALNSSSHPQSVFVYRRSRGLPQRVAHLCSACSALTHAAASTANVASMLESCLHQSS
jgi:hypothetical protein